MRQVQRGRNAHTHTCPERERERERERESVCVCVCVCEKGETTKAIEVFAAGKSVTELVPLLSWHWSCASGIMDGNDTDTRDTERHRDREISIVPAQRDRERQTDRQTDRQTKKATETKTGRD